MKKSILYTAIATAATIGISACSSSGGGDTAGIGGSGYTSSGTITGFGSIYVNGVKFDTSNSSISVDDNPGIEDDLAIGMRVTVNGTLNADGVSGTATSVSYNDDLEGPVANLTVVGNDGLIKTLSVLGRQVRINNDTTNFDGTGFDFDTIADDNHVEISGFLDSSGVMIATRVELKAVKFVITSPVETKGIVENFDPTDDTFTLANTSGVEIDASSALIDDSLAGGIVDGAFVEVKGLCSNGTCATINASKVESGFDDFGDNDEVEVEGIITSLTDQDNFEVNGIPVDASGATRIPASLTLALDKEVEVEGTFVDGMLVASEVKDESNEIKVAATVSNPAFSSDSFQVTPVSGEPPITIKIDKSTEVDDDLGNINNPDNLISNLSVGDYVTVEGYDDGSGTVVASEFERKTLDPGEVGDVIVQGIMESFNPGVDVTVLGVTFLVSGAEPTEFEDQNDEPLTQAQFNADAQDGVTLIKVKDKDDGGVLNGIADEVEIEN